MKLPGYVLAGALALCALLPTGCTWDSSGASTDATAPAADAGTDPVAGAIDAALRDLHAKMSAQAAAGWLAHVMRSSSSSSRPVLAIRTIIMHDTSQRLDEKELEQRIAQSLVEGGLVVVSAIDEYGAEDPTGLTLLGAFEDDVVEVDGERVHRATISLTVIDNTTRMALVEAVGAARTSETW